MTYTDNQLKQALAKMLPEQLWCNVIELRWENAKGSYSVLDTELLDICWRIEQELKDQTANYQQLCAANFGYNLSISWQQRTIALAKVKGIEI